jgi:(p)ppGpp synthase/HD superfamily hydrolase
MLRKAFLFALNVHAGQLRKDGTPYITHPVEVAMELARNGADETLIAAGYLHDTIEDAHVTRQQLETEFNGEIAALIANDSEDKSKSWEERKNAALDELRNSGDKKLKMLTCADKLSNLRGIYEEISEGRADVWQQFKRGKDKQAWLYREMVKALSSLEGMPMYEELKQLTKKVFD